MNPLAFDRPVAGDGYSWWYVDAISDDGRCALTIILFIGSVFSPYYFHARQRAQRRAPGTANPFEHCACNVALYGPGGRWAMTERSSTAVHITPDQLQIGPSAAIWDSDRLIIDIDEWTAPWARRIQGQVEIRPMALNTQSYRLDDAHADSVAHHWQPIAPAARVAVRLNQPDLQWSGQGYIDHNRGDGPLEQTFRCWQWSRHALTDATAIHYDITRLDGSTRTLALHFDPQARPASVAIPAHTALPTTGWRVGRHAPSENGTARVLKTLEDTPFYARSTLQTTLDGQLTTGVHESLSLERFRQPWVRVLLPFRMPRRTVGFKPRQAHAQIDPVRDQPQHKP